jgi:hypothetical protein
VWLAFVLMLIFHHSKAKSFGLASFLARKKRCWQWLQTSFLFLARNLTTQKVSALG